MRYYCLFIVVCQMVINAQPIILWDLHGVLLERKNLVSTIFLSPQIPCIIRELSWPLLKDIGAITMADEITSQDFITVAQQHNAPCLAHYILDIANAQQPMPGMIAILKELHKLGYRQQIASNIGQHSFTALIDPKQYPDLVPLFDYLEIEGAQITQQQDGQNIKKPNPLFFEKYLAKNGIDLATQPVILIDDTYANIAAARALGFDAILFRNSLQLRDALRGRGVMVAPPAYHITNQWQRTPLGRINLHS